MGDMLGGAEWRDSDVLVMNTLGQSVSYDDHRRASFLRRNDQIYAC